MKPRVLTTDDLKRLDKTASHAGVTNPMSNTMSNPMTTTAPTTDETPFKPFGYELAEQLALLSQEAEVFTKQGEWQAYRQWFQTMVVDARAFLIDHCGLIEEPNVNRQLLKSFMAYRLAKYTKHHQAEKSALDEARVSDFQQWAQ